jgi:hypothetical protein
MKDWSGAVPQGSAKQGPSSAPVCSIITPYHHGEQFIQRTIASICAQTFGDWEYIIVDDGSSDESFAVVAEGIVGDQRIRLLRQPNGGVNRARNAGLAAASPSRYLLFLDQDDCLEPEALATMVDYLDARPDVGMVYCDWQCVDAHDRPVAIPWETRRFAPAWFGRRRVPDEHPESSFATLWSCPRAMPSGSLLRRSIFEQTPGLDETYRCVGDLQLMLYMALQAPVHFLPVPQLRYRRHDANMSNLPATATELKRLKQEWWRGEMLSGREQSIARHAILFSQYLALCRHLEAITDSAHRDDLRGIPIRCWRAMRSTAGLGWLLLFRLWLGSNRSRQSEPKATRGLSYG